MKTAVVCVALSACLAHAAAPVPGKLLSLEEAVDRAVWFGPIRSALSAELNVRVAYWNLYGSRATLRSREIACFEAERVLAAKPMSPADRRQALAQVQLFRAQIAQATDTVLENERQLKALAALSADATVVTISTPEETPRNPDWDDSLKAAMKGEVMRKAKGAVQFWQFAHQFAPTASRLTGMKVAPITGMQLARATEYHRDVERKVESFLYAHYKRLGTSQEQIKANRAQRMAFDEQLLTRRKEYVAGRGTLDVLLESQRSAADAYAIEHQSLTTFNNTIALFEYATRR